MPDVRGVQRLSASPTKIAQITAREVICKRIPA